LKSAIDNSSVFPKICKNADKRLGLFYKVIIRQKFYCIILILHTHAHMHARTHAMRLTIRGKLFLL